MKNDKLKSTWMIWVSIVFCFFGIFWPGFALLPFILLIISLIKQVHINKPFLPHINKLDALYNEISRVEKDINNANNDYDQVLYQLNEERNKIKLERKKFDEEFENNKKVLENKLNNIKMDIDSKNQDRAEIKKLLFNDMKEYNNHIMYPYDFDLTDSDELNANLHKLEMNEKNLLGDKTKFIQYSLNGDLTVTYKNNQYRQIIRLFNAESSLIANKVTAKNYEGSIKRLFSLYTQINKIFELDGVSIPKQLLDIKIERMTLMKDYALKLEDEKIIRREERERIKEEQVAKKEMQNKLKELDKDIRHHNNEISKLTKYLQKAQLDVEKELYIEKIRELEENIKNLNSDKEVVEDRIVKSQSGYVYIISNIGSFGENIYKIGVTRRLEPMDRIKELSSASVPFEFDVHALIFAEDAFELENKLHAHFQKNQVNKINSKKEFFNVGLEDIKEVVLSEYNGTVNFVMEPKAEQYRETLRLLNNDNL